MSALRTVSVLLIVAGVPLLLFAQQSPKKETPIDSLQKVLTQTLNPSQRVKTLIALAKAQGKKMAKKAQQNLEKAKEIAEQNNDKKGIADVYFQLGQLWRVTQKTQPAKEAFAEALKRYRDLPGTFEQQGDVLYYTGRVLNDIQAPDSTRVLYAKAIEAYRQSKSVEKIAEVHVRDGQLLYTKGDYLNSIESIQKGLKIYQDRKKRKREGAALNALGSAYYLMRDYEKALETYKKSLKVNLESNNVKFLRSNYNNMGLCYMRLEQFPAALKNLLAAEQIAIKQGNKSTIATARNGIGNVYLKQKKLDSALYCYKLAVRLAKEIKSTYVQPFSLNGVTRVFVAMQKPDSALKYGLEALSISQRIGNKNTEQDATELLARAYEMKQEFALAYKYHKAFKHLSDSLVDEDKIKKITSLENQFTFEKEKQKQLLKEEQLNSDLKQQKLLNQAFLAGILLVMVLGFYIYRSYQTKRKANQILLEKNSLITQQNDEISQQAEELNATNNQLVELGDFKEAMMGMIVHDLKNPLNVIIGLTKGKYKAEHQSIVHQSGQRMLNLVLNILDVQKFDASEMELQTKPLLLESLVHTSVKEVELLLLQKGLGLEIQVSGQDWINGEEELIVRVVTNLLTNAIKFSLQGGTIRISNEPLDTGKGAAQTKIWVKDEGVGIPTDRLDTVFARFGQVKQKKSGGTRSTGVGLTFCKLAVEAHGGEIGVESTEGKGASFWFTLPLDVNPKNLTVTDDSSANEGIQSTTVSNNHFTKEERALLQPILADLTQYEFFEFSKIRAKITELDQFENDKIDTLKEQLNNALLAMNEERFHQLVKSV
ncbi:MAG TPA: hypothetical protein DCS93_29935 [Microscillaceae bacterium]|nr:hypothetical protein [Microscillaceae bacterium]